MTDAKRKQIKNKVEAGEARNAARGNPTLLDRTGEKAIEAKDKFTAFAREHPVATVAGGLAIGVLISSLFKRSPTRKIGARATGLATVGAQLAMAYAQRAMAAAGDAGRTGIETLDHLGERVGSSAQALGRDAAGRAGGLSAEARSLARQTGQRIESAVRRHKN